MLELRIFSKFYGPCGGGYKGRYSLHFHAITLSNLGYLRFIAIGLAFVKSNKLNPCKMHSKDTDSSFRMLTSAIIGVD